MKKSYMAAEDSDTGIKIYLREIGQIPLLTPEQEIELAAKIKKGDREARALMIRSNLRLVVKIAHDYANLGLPLLDLISEGNIGLMKAVERFDPAKGGKLSTYAAWWIKQSIKRALANQSKTIRLPVHLVDKISKMRRVSLQMSEELGREPTDEELGDEIGIASGKVSQLKTVPTRPASPDAPISADDSTSSARSLATRTRKRHSSCCGTKTCATKSAVCLMCWMIVRRRSFFSDSDWTVANRKRLRKWERNSASPANGFVSCKTSRYRSCAARWARRSVRSMSSCPWKLKLDQYLRFRTRGRAVRAFLFSFHYAQLDRIDKCT